MQAAHSNGVVRVGLHFASLAAGSDRDFTVLQVELTGQLGAVGEGDFEFGVLTEAVGAFAQPEQSGKR